MIEPWSVDLAFVDMNLKVIFVITINLDPFFVQGAPKDLHQIQQRPNQNLFIVLILFKTNLDFFKTKFLL